jgi:hypothetical protein
MTDSVKLSVHVEPSGSLHVRQDGLMFSKLSYSKSSMKLEVRQYGNTIWDNDVWRKFNPVDKDETPMIW